MARTPTPRSAAHPEPDADPVPVTAGAARVVLGLDPRDPYHRAMIEGVIEHTRAHGPWEILLAPERDSVRAHLQDRDPPDGIIAVYRTADLEPLAKADRPTVLLLHDEPHDRFSLVTDDEDAVAAMAVDYLRACGLPRLAFLDHMMPPSQRRQRFLAAAERAGLDAFAYPPVGHPVVHGWNAQTEAVADWVATLPAPVGVLCFHVVEAQQLAMACRRRGRRVPDEVAILSTNGDDIECHLVTPPLSAIDLGGERLGLAAAVRLSELMAGISPAPSFTRLPPTGITRRPSTDLQAAEDPHVAAAIRLIREQACQGLTVAELADAVGVSRRQLDYAFKAALGRTPYQQIQREQFNRARLLLLRTDLSLTEVALRSGFPYPSRLSEAFRRELGVTPSRFRRDHQP